MGGCNATNTLFGTPTYPTKRQKAFSIWTQNGTEVWRFWSNSSFPQNKQGTGPKQKPGCVASLPCPFLRFMDIYGRSISQISPPKVIPFLCRHSPRRLLLRRRCHQVLYIVYGLSSFGWYMVQSVQSVKWKPSHRRAPQKAMKRRPHRRASWFAAITRYKSSHSPYRVITPGKPIYFRPFLRVT